MTKYLVTFLLATLIFSCNNDDDIDPPVGSANAIPIYNQAYQENYETDEISNIIEVAENAYVILDPFGDDLSAAISTLKANGNEIGAYISVGTGETFRSDYDAMKPFLVDTPWGQWPDEFFVNSTTTGIIDLMKTRIDQIEAWGCDWVEFDNMDWIYNDQLRATYGFQVTTAEGIAYYQELCDYVHAKGMKCMAKNTVDNAAEFDGVLYESYKEEKNWWDESGAQSFLNAGKIVIINHYNESACAQAYADYIDIYNNDLSFICEDANLKRYVHFNQ